MTSSPPPLVPDSRLGQVLCLIVLALLALAAGYAVVLSLMNFRAITV